MFPLVWCSIPLWLVFAKLNCPATLLANCAPVIRAYVPPLVSSSNWSVGLSALPAGLLAMKSVWIVELAMMLFILVAVIPFSESAKICVVTMSGMAREQRLKNLNRHSH